MRRHKIISFLWILGSILIGSTLAPIAEAMSPTGYVIFKHPLTTLPGNVPDCERTVTQPFPPDPAMPATSAPLGPVNTNRENHPPPARS